MQRLFSLFRVKNTLYYEKIMKFERRLNYVRFGYWRDAYRGFDRLRIRRVSKIILRKEGVFIQRLFSFYRRTYAVTRFGVYEELRFA